MELKRFVNPAFQSMHIAFNCAIAVVSKNAPLKRGARIYYSLMLPLVLRNTFISSISSSGLKP